MIKKLFNDRIRKIAVSCLIACLIPGVFVCAEANDNTVVKETDARENMESESEVLILRFAKGKQLSLTNLTGKKTEELYIRKLPKDTWSENVLGTEISMEEDGIYDLKLVAKDGEELLFFNLPLMKMTKLSVFSAEKGTYVTFNNTQDEEISTQEFVIQCREEPSRVFVLCDLNIRVLPTTDSRILDSLRPGEQVDSYGVTSNNWYMIRRGDEYAFIAGEYVTENAQEAQRIRDEAAAAERIKKENTAAGRTSGSKRQTDKKKSSADGNSKTEVSRETVPGCADPDHGTIYIYYSDGSVEAVDY